MRIFKFIIALSVASVAVSASAQSWVRPYEEALRLAKTGAWPEAKAKFVEAIAARGEDTDKASQVGGSVADRRPWREGAPYSPNFGAAYATFKMAADAPDMGVRKERLTEVINKLQALVNKGQASQESLLFLAATYAANEQNREAQAVQDQLNAMDATKAFKIDQDILDAVDLAALRGTTMPAGPIGDPRAGAIQPNELPRIGVGSPTGVVPPLDFKFALLIGVGAGDGPDYALNDVDLLAEALTKHAGYQADKITILKDPTVAQIREAATAIAATMPDSGTITIFYAGAGTNDPETGKDYVAGSDSRSAIGTMLPKSDLYAPFMGKGSSIFAFYEVDRPLSEKDRYFGMEIPQTGRVVQMQSNSPGERAYATVADGKPYGVYAYAMSQVLKSMRNNRVPLSDFVWATFYEVRKGSNEGGGGGSQTPTLPVSLTMSTTARF
ncbi:MAG: caspase family protein [Armatimonadota bacterium]|nr:caspase family protein [Armatimonadota bacterium]